MIRGAPSHDAVLVLVAPGRFLFTKHIIRVKYICTIMSARALHVVYTSLHARCCPTAPGNLIILNEQKGK